MMAPVVAKRMTLSAQTEKGDWMVGGRIDINAADHYSRIGFSPNAGAFIARNFVIGASLQFDYIKSGNTKSTDFGIGPFTRLYFTSGTVKPLLQAAVSYQTNKTKSIGTGASISDGWAAFFLGAGVAIFINDNVSLEPIMGYSNTDGSSGFNFGLGFQVYLSRRQLDKVRGR